MWMNVERSSNWWRRGIWLAAQAGLARRVTVAQLANQDAHDVGPD